MRWYALLQQAATHLLFPHCCVVCGTTVVATDTELCVRCLHELPVTGFSQHAENTVEKIFWGRVQVQAAMAAYFFTQDSSLQVLLHELKYRNNKALGIQLGYLMGQQLKKSGRFKPDVIIPVPLHPKKEKWRGYNQSFLLCQGIAKQLEVPVLSQVLVKKTSTTSQTNKNRLERWLNVETSFAIQHETAITGKKVLLVDDVITTGATLEACAQLLVQQYEVQLEIAALCYTFQ